MYMYTAGGFIDCGGCYHGSHDLTDGIDLQGNTHQDSDISIGLNIQLLP